MMSRIENSEPLRARSVSRVRAGDNNLSTNASRDGQDAQRRGSAFSGGRSSEPVQPHNA